jgi:hypothetical protein
VSDFVVARTFIPAGNFMHYWMSLKDHQGNRDNVTEADFQNNFNGFLAREAAIDISSSRGCPNASSKEVTQTCEYPSSVSVLPLKTHRVVPCLHFRFRQPSKRSGENRRFECNDPNQNDCYSLLNGNGLIQDCAQIKDPEQSLQLL